ncbi:galactokinase-like [Leptidea sinapis]|uniref:galactokinase-like n=1 Tax=Leptidea sinapis TaxID=189913 RepID=UPI00212C9DB7|nr:galactokinase-like [Leptidea sinapis]
MHQEISAKGEGTLVREACDKFRSVFGRSPVAGASAPGRVNLIGEHVDYCEGFVLPVALPFTTIVVGSYNHTEECNVVSLLASGDELRCSFPASSSAKIQAGKPAWANYIKGVVAMFPEKVRGFDAVIVSDVPMGAGVSSSASLEVSFFTFLEHLTGVSVPTVTKAQLCQKAEHEFPGMPCGIMDQYIVTLGKKDHALLIDCRSLEAKHIALESRDTVILVVNSNVKHQLTGSEYPQRRAQCQQAASLLDLASLRDATAEDIKKLSSEADEIVVKRAKHVVEEISRTELVAKLLPSRDFQQVGQLFYQSHDSLSRLMEVSCPELDELVWIMRSAPGVYGARMTGGGFGGCVIALIKQEYVGEVKRKVIAEYSGTPTFFVCKPSDGAKILKLD